MATSSTIFADTWGRRCPNCLLSVSYGKYIRKGTLVHFLQKYLEEIILRDDQQRINGMGPTYQILESLFPLLQNNFKK